jgi:hypothetical protein
MEYFTRLGNLFLAVGIAELSNKMVAQATTATSKVPCSHCIAGSHSLTAERFKETGSVFLINVRTDVNILHLRGNLPMQRGKQ